MKTFFLHLLLVFLVLEVVHGLHNGPISSLNDSTSTTQPPNTVTEVLECTTNSDCFPPEFSPSTSIPSKYIYCFKGACVCTNCFTVNATDGVCRLLDCHSYTEFLKACADNRVSQLATLIITFISSFIGGGNFYIGEWQLGVIQASLFVFFLLSFYMCCCLSYCILNFNEEDDHPPMVYCCCFTCACCPLLLSFLAMFFWWLIDLIYIGLNLKYSSDGCSLYPDL